MVSSIADGADQPQTPGSRPPPQVEVKACRPARQDGPPRIASSRSRVPVAGPPPRPSAAVRRIQLSGCPAVAADPDRSWAALWAAFWTPASLKGWAGSMALHGALLLDPGPLVLRLPLAPADQLRQPAGRLAPRRSRGADLDRGAEHAAAHARSPWQRARLARRYPDGTERRQARAGAHPGQGVEAERRGRRSPTTTQAQAKATDSASPSSARGGK